MTPYWLVTGAAGFIGARMVERCNQRGIPVISVDDLGAFDSREEHQGLDFGIRLGVKDLWSWLEKNPPPRSPQ